MNVHVRKVTAAIGIALIGTLAWRLRRAPNGSQPLETVPYLDLKQYMGRWFEISRYPTRFERKCAKNATAEYTLRPDGTVQVENRCTRNDGAIDSVRGVARVADPASNAKLKVRFSPFMPWADYWVTDLDDAYGWAVVGEPSRRFLWVLSRTPSLTEDVYRNICERLRARQYDPDRLVRTPQDEAGR